MTKLQPVRGTHDLLGDDILKFRYVAEVAMRLMRRYNFSEIATPIFEFTDVFARTLGDDSDIVNKEMYTFEDRGGEKLTLRPENTAAVVRALLSNGLTHDVPLKLYYYGPMFRYERPQKGRQRQFHQVGAELIGADAPQADAEVIKLAQDFLATLGVGKDVVLHLNTLGDMPSRQSYRAALVGYFEKYAGDLSEDSQRRLKQNPLRILDSKDEGDRKIIVDAPRFRDFLSPQAQDFYATLKQHLGTLGVPYIENERLVRGLDYYSHTVFEFVTETLGAQGTVLAGGRYDGLVEQMGGPSLPAVGWAAGMERLMMMVTLPVRTLPMIAVVPIGEAAVAPCLRLLDGLRAAGFTADMAYSGNVGKRMKRADKIGADYAVMIGDDELKGNAATIRDLATGEQIPVAQDQVISYVTSVLSGL